MFQHDYYHSGRGEAIGPDAPIIKWKKGSGYKILTGVVIDEDGNLFFGTQTGYLISVDSSGNERWKFLTQGLITSTPIILEDTVYVGSFDGTLYAVSRLSGEEVWRKEIGHRITSPIIYSQGRLFFAAETMLVSINAANRSVIWEINLGQEVTSAPVVDDEGYVYVQSFYGGLNQGVFCISPSGTQKWFVPTGGGTEAGALLHSGDVVMPGKDGVLYCFSPSGTPQWFTSIGYNLQCAPAVASSGYIYIGSDDGNLYKIDPQDGSIEWRQPVGTEIVSPVVIDRKENIYVASTYGILYCFDKDGIKHWEKSIFDRVDLPMAMDKDGTLYMVYNDTVCGIGPGTGIEERSREKYVFKKTFINRLPPEIEGVVYSKNGERLFVLERGTEYLINLLSEGVYFVKIDKPQKATLRLIVLK